MQKWRICVIIYLSKFLDCTASQVYTVHLICNLWNSDDDDDISKSLSIHHEYKPNCKFWQLMRYAYVGANQRYIKERSLIPINFSASENIVCLDMLTKYIWKIKECLLDSITIQYKFHLGVFCLIMQESFNDQVIMCYNKIY